MALHSVSVICVECLPVYSFTHTAWVGVDALGRHSALFENTPTSVRCCISRYSWSAQTGLTVVHFIHSLLHSSVLVVVHTGPLQPEGPLKRVHLNIMSQINKQCYNSAIKVKRSQHYGHSPPDITTLSLPAAAAAQLGPAFSYPWVESHPPTCWWSWFLRQPMKHAFSLARLVSPPTPSTQSRLELRREAECTVCCCCCCKRETLRGGHGGKKRLRERTAADIWCKAFHSRFKAELPLTARRRDPVNVSMFMLCAQYSTVSANLNITATPCTGSQHKTQHPERGPPKINLRSSNFNNKIKCCVSVVFVF